MSVDVLLGLQWGDEGKGKVVDFLANNYDIVARFQGGPNAGHTLYVKGQKIVLHHIPSGIFHQRPLNLIGNGVVIDPVSFQKEIEKVKQAGANVAQKLFISRKAHLILPTHKLLDAASEAAKGKDKIGSTLRGIGPTYMDKIGRNGLRVGDVELGKFEQYYKDLVKKHQGLLNHLYQYEYDLPALETEFFESIELLRSMQLVDGEYMIHNALKQGKKVLAEGAQGSMLDIDFGTYPFVTSSNTITAGVCSGLGIAAATIGEVIGITKAYCTRVGSGPFPTELLNETGEHIRQAGGEFGATTGRPRRCGWIDLPALRYAVMLNGVTQLVMTKADVLSALPQIAACVAYEVNGSETPNLPYDLDRQPVEPVLKQFECWQQDLAHCTGYDDLPASLQNYIAFIEQYLGVPITIVSVGPGREQLVHKKAEILL
ncbi:adenylosuccinate synthase [Sphingobacteriales bacterium UPWRP_1]|nr:adenylosuccinate synthase [Sphingobacteriales bacterium TSM_CSS]PSJ77656.1 adenylosuccinate synthase [Sphingobacteriales bacterium UPWRP_1]